MQGNGSHVPSDVEAEEGRVFIEGPGNVAFALNPEAAAETGERISREAVLAAHQRDNASSNDPGCLP
jgi:hypothetical protein